MSALAKGKQFSLGHQQTDDHKAKIGAANKGRAPWNKGGKRPDLKGRSWSLVDGKRVWS